MAFAIGLEQTWHSWHNMVSPPQHHAVLGDKLSGHSYWVVVDIDASRLMILLFIALWLSVSISEYLDPRTRIQRVGAG
jgi:hypothetical protein